IRTLISVVSNIELQVDYNYDYGPMYVNNNLGGVAGLNSGLIQNIATSGSLVANDKVNIGGLVGENTGVLQECANYGTYIEGYAKLYEVNGEKIGHHEYITGVDIYQEQNIGGIVGYNNSGSISNVRTMFVLFEHEEVSVRPIDAEIKGVGNVGGVVGKARNTHLVRAYVENFVADNNELVFNILGNSANVAGLIAVSESSSATLSFVQADFDIGGSEFYEFGKGLSYQYTYFIGDVLSSNLNTSNPDNVVLGKEHNSANPGTSYIVNNVVYTEDGDIVKNVAEFGVEDIEEVLNTSYSVLSYSYTVRWLQNETINNGYPYLVYSVGATFDEDDYAYTITIKPTDIIVNVDENYFDDDAVADKINRFEKYDNGIYLQYVDDNETVEVEDDTAVATAVVYYYENGNNRHTLLSSGNEKGLLEKTILPSMATGSHSISIISGAQIASLTDSDKTITFYGTGKVEIKFTSLFDRTVQDVVTIFVENPLSEDVFNITTSNGLDDRTGQGQRFTTRVGVNSLVSVNLDKVNEQAFNTSKVYMNADIESIEGLEAGTNQDEYFKFIPITNEIDENSNKFILGQFAMEAIKVPANKGYIEVKVNISVYLNLDKYTIGQDTLSTLSEDMEVKLATRTITIVVYNKATALSVSSDIRAESGVRVNISADLTTGYVNVDNPIGTLGAEPIGEKGNRLLIDVSGQDKVDIVINAKNDNALDLVEGAKNSSNNPNFSIWDLFDRVITYQLFNSNDGYSYVIHLTLKEEYRYLDIGDYLDREWRFELEIIANSNSELSKFVDVSFVPQQLTSFRLENYSNLVSRAGETAGTTIAEFESSEVESSLIIPGESGLVKIFAEYSYSYFENVSINFTSEDDSSEYIIRFQQMVYNKNTGKYESYAGITANGESLPLKKVSYINESGEYEYKGVIFVRTILDKMVGIRKTFTINVNATTYDLQGNATS
ncbi:MAG: hypothetical protein J6Q15_00125, partial [Clostridia bacterium]|nr:hypothetical protein [Clostridia bacterium]